MKSKIKWGVIGSGGIAKRRTIPEGIIPAENAELTAVYDVNAEANGAVAKEFNVKAVSSVEELLQSDVDAVYVASPANCHFNHVLKAGRSGKHILCEKPLGMSVQEAREMINICNQNQVNLGIGLMIRFQRQHQEALRMINTGILGKMVYGRAQMSCWYPLYEGAWRQNPITGGGGSLMDMGTHCLDLLEMFMGKIKAVSCMINRNVHSYKSEDSAIVMMIFESGAMGSVDAYFCIPDESSKNILELYGSKGSIIAKGTVGQAPEGEMIAFLQKNSDYNPTQNRDLSNGILINPIPLNTYQAEIEDFSNAIIENRKPLNSYELGLRNQMIVEACYKSARTGKVINL